MLPFAHITDVQLIKTENLDTLCIKVVEDEAPSRSGLSEEYYFTYFTHIQSAFDAINQIQNDKSKSQPLHSMYDSTGESTLPPKPESASKKDEIEEKGEKRLSKLT